ncbi:MAG: hypothetical protein AAFY59_17440, partial [Pseudomonadota bacterium]
MLYFTMEIDPEAGGEYPQVNTASFVGSMISAWEWPSALALQKLAPRLDAAAVQTDILSEAATSAFGFLVSRKVKTFLADFTLMGHRYFDCPVEGDAPELEHYTWLHLLDPRLVHQLDYQRSSFVEEDYFDEVETIEITSFEHYQALKAEDADAKPLRDENLIRERQHRKHVVGGCPG